MCGQDKWRNLSVSNAAQGSKDKSRGAPKAKILTVTPPPSNITAQISAPAADALMDDVLSNATDGKNAPRLSTTAVSQFLDF